ncbi:MAG: iron-sulfur cluster assembly scaffold protein [Steroidobacteraceae bacterium]
MTTDDPRYCAEIHRRMRELPGAGDLPPGGARVVGRAGDREQGAEVSLEFGLECGRVVDARFRAFGCPYVIAAASWLCERLRGADRAALAGWDWREAAEALEVPPARFGRLITLQDAVRDAVRNWPGEPRSTV